jgi:hypothetical protein
VHAVRQAVTLAHSAPTPTPLVQPLD